MHEGASAQLAPWRSLKRSAERRERGEGRGERESRTLKVIHVQG